MKLEINPELVDANSAIIALDNLDDYARMADTVPTGAIKTLKDFIMQRSSPGELDKLSEHSLNCLEFFNKMK